MSTSTLRKNERGIALILSLLALLLISAVGLGMIYMSSTETTINSNYKDTQVAFFAMRGGLEEMRDRMRTTNTSAITLPAVMPGSANSIIYIINPAGTSDVVDPKTSTNAYFDDEFCHESFTTSGVTYVAPGTKCTASGAPPSLSVGTYVPSISPTYNTSAAMKYKWARITLKQNGTFPTAFVDSGQPASAQACWDSSLSQERASTAMGGALTCAAAVNLGYDAEPMYLLTSMAITPSGSRRVGQYEIAASVLSVPAAGLSLDGPSPSFGTPHSANAGINGTDGSGTPPALTGCSASTGAQPAIGTDGAADAALVAPQIFRPTNFTGSGATNPSVVPETLTPWSTPAQANSLANVVAGMADTTLNCGIGGSGCTGTYGTTAHPQITYANGDVNLNGGAGILVVTGTLSISGVMEFDGLVLVIGQGAVVINGGGNGSFYGEMFIANTNNSTAPYAQLATLGSPSFTWKGGGKSSMYYNSCWADIGNTMHYTVQASREEMY
jgi:type IV pilus assembly PilX-like protein